MPVDSKVQIDSQELTTNLNYLQPTGFRVIINRTRYPNLEYFVQSVSHQAIQPMSPLMHLLGSLSSKLFDIYCHL